MRYYGAMFAPGPLKLTCDDDDEYEPTPWYTTALAGISAAVCWGIGEWIVEKFRANFENKPEQRQ
jgi:hypothetical protein